MFGWHFLVSNHAGLYISLWDQHCNFTQCTTQIAEAMFFPQCRQAACFRFCLFFSPKSLLAEGYNTKCLSLQVKAFDDGTTVPFHQNLESAFDLQTFWAVSLQGWIRTLVCAHVADTIDSLSTKLKLKRWSPLNSPNLNVWKADLPCTQTLG